MYTEIKGNIFNTTVKYIMHQVNAQGVMGAGLTNGDWQVIKNLIQTYLNKLNVFVYRL